MSLRTDVTGDNIAEEDVTGDNIAEEDVTGNDITEEDVTGDNIADADVTGNDITEEDVTGDNIIDADVAGREFSDGDTTHDGVTCRHDKWLRRAAAVMMEQIRLMINETNETTRTAGRKTRVARRKSSTCVFTPPNKVLMRWRTA